MIIRDALEGDLEPITAIYNEVLLNTTAIYRDEPATIADRIAWWQSRREQNYPMLVASVGNSVMGFATFGDFRPWPGYRYTVEHTVHVHASSRGQGLGSALMQALIARAGALGKHVIIGGIDAANIGSLRMHERLGFERTAHLKQVGFKFGRYLDLVFVQLTLRDSSIGEPRRNVP